MYIMGVLRVCRAVGGEKSNSKEALLKWCVDQAGFARVLPVHSMGLFFVNKPKREQGGEQQEEEGREQITVKCVLVV